MDFLQYFIQKLIGLDYWLEKSNNGNRTLGEATSEDMIFKFLYDDSVQKVFRALIAIFVILLIIFTIYQIIKSEWDYMAGDGSKGNSKTAIFRSSLKAIALVIVFPVLLVMGIVSSNAILASIINAIGVDMSSTFGGKIFAISATSANKYRHYADTDVYKPISDKVTFYLDDNGNLITFGQTARSGCVVYDDYTEYLYAAKCGTEVTIDSIFDPLVPSKLTSFSGFCFKVEDVDGNYKYYLIQTNGTNRDGIYKYLTLVLGAKVLSENADWAREDDIGTALLKDKKLNFSSGTNDGCFISDVDISVCSETTRTVCRNSWNYSLVYLNPNKTLSQSVASVGGQLLSDYNLASTTITDPSYGRTGAILYNSDEISGYFDGGQFGIVQSKAEYQVMADVVDYMCDNNLTFYIMDATSSLINWNYSYQNSSGTKTSYTVDNDWISNKLVNKVTAAGANAYYIKNSSQVATTITRSAEDGSGTKNVVENTLTFLTSYSNSNTLPAEHEQDIIYTAKFDVGDESQGSRYIICLKDGDAFYPLVNGKEFRVEGVDYTFKSDHYASDYTGVVWAKGTFDTSTVNATYGNPTYLKNTSTSTDSDLDKKSNMNGKYYYSISDDNKTINVYSYGTRFIETTGSSEAYVAYNNGNIYFAGNKTFNASFVGSSTNMKEATITLTTSSDVPPRFSATYTLNWTGVTETVDSITYYQYASEEEGFAYVLYSDGSNLYHAKNKDGANGIVIDKDNTGGNNLHPCYLNGKNSRDAADLVLETISISDPQLGSTASSSLKSTFSIFDGEEYVGTFQKMSLSEITATAGSVGKGTKKFTTNSGAEYYNIQTMGKFTNLDGSSSTDAADNATGKINTTVSYNIHTAIGQMINFYETAQTSDSVTCYRYNIEDYKNNSFGSVLIELNIHLFKGVHDFKFGTVQQISEAPQASITFLNAGTNEGITFDYFFDQNVNLQTFYSAAHINYLILLVSTILIIKVLFTSLWGVIKRFYMITLYYLAMPIAASTMPLDGGSRFGDVRKKIVGEVLSTYGVLIGLNVFFVLLAPIESISSTIFTEEAIANSGSYFLKKLPISAKMLNKFIYILFLLVAFTLIGELPAFIQGTLVKEGTDLNASGGKVKGAVKTTMSDAKAGLSGESLKKSVKETASLVPGLIPGSAAIGWGVKKAAGGVKTLSDSFKKGKDEASGDGDGEKKSNGRDDYEYDDYDGHSNARDDDESEENENGGGSGGGSSGGGRRSNARDDGEGNPLDDEPTDNEQILENSQSGTGENEDTDENGEETSEEENSEGRNNKPLTEDDVRRIIQEELEGKRGDKGDKGETGKDGKKDNVKIGDDLSDSKVLRQVLKDRAKAGGDGKFITDKAGNKYTIDKKGSIIDENGKRVKGDKLRELKKDLLKNGVTSEEKKKALGKLKKKKAIQNIATKALIGGLAAGAVGLAVAGSGGLALIAGGTALAGAVGVGGASKIYKTVNRYRRADDATRAQMIKKMGNQALTVAGVGALTLATGGAGGLALAAMAGTSGVLVARNARRVRRGDHSRAYGAYGELSGEGGSTVASSANNAVNNAKKKSKSGVFTKRNDAMVADVARSAIKSGVADKVLKKNGNSLMVKGKKLENVSFDKKGNIYSNGKKLTGKELRDARVALNNEIRKTDKKGFAEAVGKAKKKQAKTALIRKSAKVAALAGVAALTGPLGLVVAAGGAKALDGVVHIGKRGVDAVRNFRDMDPEKKKALLKKWGGTALKVGAIGAGTVLTGGVGLALGGAAGAALGVGALGATGFLTKRAVSAVKAYRGADDETKAQMIRHYGNRFVAVAGAGALTLATGGAGLLALGAAGATGGAIIARDEIKVRRYAGLGHSSSRENDGSYVGGRSTNGNIVSSRQSVAVSESYINKIVDKRVKELINNAKETGVLLEGRDKEIATRAIINNEAIDDKRFVSNIPEAYRNVLVNSAGTKAARVIAGDVIENMAVENGTTVHKEVIDHISDDRKLEIYKSVMTEDQLKTLEMRFAKERADSTEMVKFIENSNLGDGLGLSLQASVDAKKGLMFSVNDKQVVDKAVLRDIIKEILGSDGISTDRVISSMQSKGYTTNVEAALAANYATSVNYSTETTGNVSSEYHENVFAEAMKDATIRSEAILQYLNNNKGLMKQFLEKYSYITADGEYFGDVSDESLLTTIQNKMDTDEFFTKMSVEDYSKELSEAIGRHIQDGSFKVEAFDLLSKEEQMSLADQTVANIAEMSNGREYAFTTDEKAKVGEFSAEVFDDSSLVSTFANSQDEMKDEIINSVIAKYFGLTKEDGSIDVSSKEAVKLLKEMQNDDEFSVKLASGAASKEDLLVEFAKSKLQKQVSASNEVVGNINDKKPIEDMVIGKNTELVALLNGYKNIDLLSTEDVQRIAKARNEYNLLFNELRTAFGYVEGGKKDINTRAEARAKAYISAGGDITKVAKSGDSEKDSQVLASVHQAFERRGLGQEYLQKLSAGLAEYHSIGSGKFENIERLRMSGETKDGLLQKIEAKGYSVDNATGDIIKLGENQPLAATGQGSRTGGFVSDAQLLEAMIDNSSSREESTKNLAEILRNVLSVEQINSLQKAGFENGFIALGIQQQNELLAKLATSDKGALRVLERNSVDTQNSEAVINFLNSKLGANLRERLISNMDVSLYEAKELLAGKSEAEIHGTVQGEVERARYAEQVQKTQGELISTENIQAQMIKNADDYTKLVEMAVGKFKLIGEQDLGLNQIVGNIRNATIINDESTIGGDKDIISMLETLKRYGSLSTEKINELANANYRYKELYGELLNAFGYREDGDKNKNAIAETMARAYISTNGHIDDVIANNKTQVDEREFEAIRQVWDEKELTLLNAKMQEYASAGKTKVDELAKLQAEGITKEDLIKNLEAKNITVDTKTGDITKVAGGSSASPEQKIKLAQDLLANGGLERFRSVAEFVLNDTALKNSATGLLKSKTGEDLDSLNMIDKYNFLFNHYKEIAKEGTDERAELERLATQKIEFNNQFGNKTVLEKLKPEEIEVLIKDMGRDGKSLVAKAGQEHIKQISESEKIDIVPDTKMMSKEESLRFRENLATLQQAYTKGEGEEMFVSLFKNATLVNQKDIIREIVSGGKELTDAAFAGERAKILESNPEFIEKVDRLTAKDVIERKEFGSSLEKIKKYLNAQENTNFDALSEQEKLINVTRIFNDEKLRRKAGIVGTEFADFEKLARKIKEQEIKAAGDYDVKQSFTNEQIMAYLRAHENTRQKLIEIGASQPNYMFAKNKYEKALRNFAINNSVMRQATMIQYANQTYSSTEIRQLIRNEITNSNSPMYRKETQKLTDKEIIDYINKHLEELKALFAEDKLLKKNFDGSFELKNPKEQNFEFDKSIVNAMANKAVKNIVDKAVSEAIEAGLGKTNRAQKKTVYQTLIKELTEKLSADADVQKVIDAKINTSLPDAFNMFLGGQSANILLTDTIKQIANPIVDEKAYNVFSNQNKKINITIGSKQAQIRSAQARLNKLNNNK